MMIFILKKISLPRHFIFCLWHTYKNTQTHLYVTTLNINYILCLYQEVFENANFVDH